MNLTLNSELRSLIISNLLLILWLTCSFKLGAAKDTLGGKVYNKILFTNDELVSKNGKYKLVMQSDCNLVFYANDAPKWASGTNGKGKLCVMKLGGGDTLAFGNYLIIIDYMYNTIWQYNEGHKGDCYLQVTNDGELLFQCAKLLSDKTITSGSGKKCEKDTLGYSCLRTPVLFTNDYLCSPNEEYRVVMQGDCNLVLYHQKTGTALWSSGTSGKGTGCKLLPKGSPGFKEPCYGDSVTMVDYQEKEVWSYQGHGSCGLVLQNNGHLIFPCKDIIYSIKNENAAYEM